MQCIAMLLEHSIEKYFKISFVVTKKGITFAPVFAQVVKLVDTPA